MDDRLSNKLRLVSFVSMILVVYIHSYAVDVKFSNHLISVDNKFNLYVQNFVSQGIARSAVPIFFLISGFLFFQGRNVGTMDFFRAKIRRRLKSLVVPYLFWSLLGILLYWMLQSFSMSKSFFTQDLIKDYTLNKLITVLFLDPIPYQFWFVRDLFLLIFVSPVLYLCIKCCWKLALIIFLYLWGAGYYLYWMQSESLLFFFIGSLIAITRFNIENAMLKENAWLLCVCWISLLVLKHYVQEEWIHKLAVCFGVLTIWFGYDKLSKSFNFDKIALSGVFSYSFFIFAFHEPFLTIIKKASYYMWGNSEISSILIYFFAPAFVITIAILLGTLLKKKTPVFYYIITGGR